MFICGKCKKNSKSGEKATKLVTKTRPVKYKDGSIGREIVEEMNVCSKCEENWNEIVLGWNVEVIGDDSVVLFDTLLRE